MNRFSLAKNLFVLGIVLLGLLIASPNMFGDDYAINVASSSGQPVQAATLEEITKALDAANVDHLGASIEGNAALLRFPTFDSQQRASDVLRREFPTYVAALTLAPRTPAFLDALGLKPMALGLDLRGGVELQYQVDLPSAVQQYLEAYQEDLRRQLRQASIRTTALDIANGAIEVGIYNEDDLPRAEQIIRNLDRGDQLIQLGQATGRLEITPMRGQRTGFRVRLTEAAIRERQDFAIEQNTLTLRNRVNELGVAETVVQRQGLDRILVQLPGVTDPAQAKAVLGSTATVQFHLVDTESDAYEAMQRGRAPAGSMLHYRKDGSPILLRREIIASGSELVDATSGYSQGQPAVFVRLNSQGARRMLDTTAENVGRFIAVLFIEDKPQLIENEDGEVVAGRALRVQQVINDAVIQGVFSSNFQITGLSPFEANNLALLLRAGSLAAPIVPISERVIGPSLGADNIKRGIEAVVIGYLLVVLFISLYYRVFGVLANIALLANMILLVALMSIIPGAVLTLPGIAGIVLTVGMAVDANVLIYERIREELRNGNSPQQSIRLGFDKAYTTIVDANVTTVIAGIVLFAFGSGPVKGFAVTLTLGIATSMFSAITVTRALVNLVYGTRPHVKKLSIGGNTEPVNAAPAV